MHKFECEICNKEVKRGKKFSLDMFEMDTDCTGTGFLCEDEICSACAKKIENKIKSMRKAAKIRKEHKK